jgi:AraC-like DNA-binding protein
VIFRLLIGPSFRPVRVALPTAPTAAAAHERFFGCPVTFDSDYAGLELASTDLDRRRSSDDPLVREHVARYLDAEGPADDDLVAQILHLIDRTLSTGHANTTTVAAHLGLHPRTLHRWLTKHDETFGRLLDNVRREKATHYLTESTMPLGRIAGLLGYSQQSCLTRSCIRWFDASPRDIRASVASR